MMNNGNLLTVILDPTTSMPVLISTRRCSGKVVRQSIVLREDMPALPTVYVVEGFVPYSTL